MSVVPATATFADQAMLDEQQEGCCPFGVVEWGVDFEVLRWEGGAARYFRLSPDEALRRPIDTLAVVHPGDLLAFRSMLFELRSSERHQAFERFRTARSGADYEYFEWSCSATFDEVGTLRSVIAFIRPCSPIRHAEPSGEAMRGESHEERERLTRIERELHALVDMQPALISYIDPSFRYVRISHGYQRWMGIDPQWAIGRTVEEVLGESVWRVVRPIMERALSGQAVTYERPLDYRGLGPRWVRVSYTPDLDESGTVHGISVLVIDIGEERRMAESLRVSEANFRGLFELSAIGVAQVDPGSERIVRANPRFCEITGYSHAELLERTLLEITHPEDRTSESVPAFRGELGSEFWETEKRFLRPDGSVVWVQVTSRVLKDERNHPFGSIVSVIDLTERKRTEEALRRSEERFARAFGASPDGLVITSADGVIQEVNESFLQLVGMQSAEVIGRSLFELHLFDHASDSARALELLTAQGHIKDFQTRVRSRAAGVRTVLLSSEWLELSGERSILTIVRDVTDQRVAERELRESEQRLRAVLDVLPVPVFIADGTGKLVATNQAANTLWGPTRVPSIATEEGANYGEEHRAWWPVTGMPVQAHQWGMARAIGTGESCLGEEMELEGFHGERLTILNYAIPVRDQDGKISGGVAVNVDITNHKRTQVRDQLLLRLDDTLRPLSDPKEMTLAAARLLGEHLRVDRCAYAEVGPDQDSMYVTGNYTRGPEVQSIVGRMAFHDFGGEVLRLMREDCPFVVDDVDTHQPPINVLDSYRATQTRALICMPLHKRGRLVAAITVHCAAPRQWREREVEVVRAVAARCWESIERARVQRELQEREESLRRFVETANEGILRIGPKDEIRFANDYFCQLLGYEYEEVVGMHILDFLFPEDREAKAKRRAARKAAREAGAGERYELRLRHKGGREVWVLYSTTVSFKDGRYDGTYSMLMDITDRKRTEQALRESEARFRAMADSAPVLVWMSDPANAGTWFNRGWLEYTGRTLEQECGDGWTEGLHADDRERCLQTYREHFDRREEFKIEYRLRRFDGEYRWVLNHGVPRKDSDGAFLGFIGTCIDVTAIVHAREAMRRHGEELERLVRERTAALEESNQRLRISERMAALGTLSAGLGHDMGNILMPVRVRLGSLEAMRLPQEAQRELEGLKTAAEYLRKLAVGLRQLAVDPHAGSDREVTDIAAWWGETEAVLRNALPRGVTLEGQVPGESGWAKIPRAALTQVVFNLVQNAGEVMKGAGGGKVTVAALRTDTHLVLSVSDNGPGMTEQVKRRCMEPFFTTKTRRLSTGLGLALVYGLIREAGGTVELESELGRGTEFRLMIPLAEPPNEREVQQRALLDVQDARIRAYITAELSRLGVGVTLDKADVDDVQLIVSDGAHEHHGDAQLITVSSTPSIRELRSVLRRAVNRGRERS